ncbi:MAG: hypothetical protein DI536_03660 [Archangium gephyra]|uniref:UmuC domain-containing protein n=1 Tax=Archangium gephyra TaxID=48 RepID=A0A2W5TS26_9BACT|nr:MAG: hypothetical protein DI536_03660 [Archangium gephyra]
MDRLACVEVPVLPLQLLLRAKPEWREGPVAVVAEDAPLGIITHVNEAARKRGVLPGLKYGEALSLCSTLHAAVVDADEVKKSVDSLLTILRDWSPSIEVSAEQPGVFWVDARGLSLIFPSLETWGVQVMASIRQAGWRASMCVGFSRFGSFAIAKSLRLDMVKFLATPEEEKRLISKVPLRRVGLSPESLAALKKLGVTLLGEFLALPVGGLRKRYGESAERLALAAAGKRLEPFQPTAAVVPVQTRVDFDEPVVDSNQLVFASLAALRQLMQTLEERQLALRSLTITMEIDRPKGAVNVPIVLNVALADATTDGARVIDQVRLTLSSELAKFEVTKSPLPTGERVGARRQTRILSVIEGDGQLAGTPKPILSIVPPSTADPAPTPEAPSAPTFLGVRSLFFNAGGAPAPTSQLALVDRPRRDPFDTRRTLERLRATFGPLALQQLTHGAGHLPESRLRFELLKDLPPLPTATTPALLRIRRMNFKAELLPSRPNHEPDGWLVLGERGGPVARHHGPFFVNGGWWRGAVNRHYYFLELERGGQILWCYFDALRRRWMRQGDVE